MPSATSSMTYWQVTSMSDGAITALVVMTLLFLPLAFFSICTALKNIDLKLTMNDMLTLYDVWKNSREKSLWELEKKYLT